MTRKALSSLDVQADESLNLKQICAAWQGACAGAGIASQPISLKGASQLRVLFAVIGDQAEEVLRFILTNWQEFVGKVTEKDSPIQCLEEPKVGFLVSARMTAIAMWMHSTGKVWDAPTTWTPEWSNQPELSHTDKQNLKREVLMLLLQSSFEEKRLFLTYPEK